MNVFYDPVAASFAAPPKTPASAPQTSSGLSTSFVAVGLCEAAPGQVTTETKIKRMLYSHHGRDKLFKLVQYGLRLHLWLQGVAVEAQFVADETASAKFTAAQRTWMTVTNTRRMFKVGRFVAEFSRVGQTVRRIAALADLPPPTDAKSERALTLLQVQMVLDIIARLIMCVKSSLDDICWASRKGFLHPAVEDRYNYTALALGMPVLLIDLLLNSMRLAQGVIDAAGNAKRPRSPVSFGAPTFAEMRTAGASTGQVEAPQLAALAEHDRISFSLLTTYDELDRSQHRPLPRSQSLRRVSTMAPTDSPPPLGAPLQGGSRMQSPLPPSAMATPPLTSPRAADSGAITLFPDTRKISRVHSIASLLWTDDDLRWASAFQLKLVLDVVVLLLVLSKSKATGVQGVLAVCGILSGIISVRRVWLTGK